MYPADELRTRLRGALVPAPDAATPPGSRPAAVLIPILAAAPEPRLVFTRRTETLRRHPGEISFPGGLVDGGEDPAAAALREAEEELGLAPADVELLGALEPVHTHVSGILVFPFVGMLWRDPRYTPNAAEIAEVLEFPLPDLMAAREERELEHDGQRFTTFVYDMDGPVIWGATGRILTSFLDVLDHAAAGRRE